MVDSSRLGNGAVERQLEQARVAVERENWPLAEDRLRRVLAARPGELELVRLLAQVVRELGRAEEAEALLVEAIRAAGEAPETWVGRRDCLLELADLRLAGKRAGDAARALKRVLMVEPHHAEALSLLGDVFFDGEHWAEAVNAYRESVAANPFEPHPWWNLALALERRGDRSGAALALEGYVGVCDPSERDAVEADIERLRGGS